MDKVIIVENLLKKYGNQVAINNISFSVKKGSCFGLLGPNGAGKSTTMKILAGILNYNSGNVQVLGQDALKLKDKIKANTGYVPQEITLYDKLSAYDNLVFFGELYGIKGVELKERIMVVLEQVGLKDHAKNAISTFSGGMKRRINIACALLHKPELLILDEPTVGIDPQSRNHIFNMIKDLTKEGVTILYSTHYMEEVETLCDEIAIVDQGKVIAQGALSELLDKYAQNVIYLESEQIKKLPHYNFCHKITPKDKGWVIETTDVLGTMKDITEKAILNKMSIKELEIVRPTLEMVFLTLTGTSLRD